MATRKQETIRQHESIRVPQGWTEQDKALIGQLERIFDDIYKRFGRLDWTDFGENLKNGIVTSVAYDAVTQKLTITINGATSDVARIATLDGNGKVPASQLPSYVDDVEEYADFAHFPPAGETDKIYVALDTGFTYRWSGTQYVRLNTYDEATQSASGLMSALDKKKLDGVAEGATANIGTLTSLAMNGSTIATSGAVDLGDVVKSIKMNNVNITPSGGVANLGTVITAHQSVASIKAALGSFTWGALAGE